MSDFVIWIYVKADLFEIWVTVKVLTKYDGRLWSLGIDALDWFKLIFSNALIQTSKSSVLYGTLDFQTGENKRWHSFFCL